MEQEYKYTGRIINLRVDKAELPKVGAALEAAGFNTLFLLGWEKGGFARMWPDYVVDERMGGEEKLREGIEYVHRKGGKEVIVYFGDEVEEALKRYLDERTHIIPLSGHEQALFLSAALNTALGNHRLEDANKAILRIAEHDYLTALYNRRGFLRELEHRLQLPETQDMILTLFAMDMDRLKTINDVYGHHEGDTAIQCLAQAILKATEGKGICARYGGDEVVAILQGRDYEHRAELMEQLGKQNLIYAQDGGVVIACGLSEFIPAEDEAVAAVFTRADAAMYKNKKHLKTGR